MAAPVEPTVPMTWLWETCCPLYIALVQVKVVGDVLITVLDEHIITVGPGVACLDHLAIAGGVNGFPAGAA